MELKINLSNTEHKDLLAYCNLNDLLISSVVKDSFTTGFNIERYGLLNSPSGTVNKEVIKEVIKYVEVPVVEEKEVVRIEYVEVEKPIEVIKEVIVEKVVIKEVIKEIPVEKIVTKTEYVSDDTQINELLLKIQQLEDAPPRVVEVIKEVIVEKEVGGGDKSKLDALQATVQKIRADNLEKDRLIKEYEKTIQDIQKLQENKQAVYLRGSNLNKTL
jgi:hypothetical protein